MSGAHRTALPSFLLSWLGWLLVLFLIYPVEHTIALRNLLFLVPLLVFFRHPRLPASMAGLLPEALVLGVLTLWLWAQTLWISPYTAVSAALLAGDWMVAMAVAAAGALAVGAMQLRVEEAGAHRAWESACRAAATALAAALWGHVLFCLGEQVWVWLRDGAYPLGYARFGNRDNLSVLNNTALALVLGDLTARHRLQRPALAWPRWVSLALLAMGSLATYTLMTRNGTAGLIVMMLVFSWLLVRGRRRRLWAAAATAAVLAAAGLAYSSLKSDIRWQTFRETARIAWDTEHQRWWLNSKAYPYPMDASGMPVDESAYLRLAWAKVAVGQIAKHPLGVGYDHQALGQAMRLEVLEPINVGSSHNGLLEFTVANGLPALALWLGFMALLFRRGWVAANTNRNPAGYLLLFTALCYLARIALDSHLTGFRLEMFLFMAAILAAGSPSSADTARA